MPTTFVSIALAVLAVLPGALYTWTFEQQTGRWGANATDRLLRFGGASALFLVAELPLIYQGYRELVVTHRLSTGKALPWWTWLLPLLVVLVPILLGRLAGRAVYQRRAWVSLLTGPSPAPRAWDDLFAQADLSGWVLLRLKGGGWIGGLWGRSLTTGLRSYAAGYPEEQDLLIAETAEVDESGVFMLNATGKPDLRGVAALVRWAEVEYAEFIPG